MCRTVDIDASEICMKNGVELIGDFCSQHVGA